MATGRIGVTPTLGTRWSKAPAGGTTSLSGLDDNSVALVYSVGYEQVYRNGVLLSRGNDYTATTGNSITLIDATIAGDIIEVFANELVPLTDAISKGQFTAKGALLSATAASTPGVLTVGSNNQVLTADSTTATGLKWANSASTDALFTAEESGYYILPPFYSSSVSNQAMTLNQTIYAPVYLPAGTYDRIGFKTGGTVTTSGTMRLGLYNINATTNKPDTVVFDAGTVAVTTGSTNYEITISQTLNAGWYYLAMNMQSGAFQVTTATSATVTGINNTNNSNYTTSTRPSIVGYTQSGVTGAFATATSLSVLSTAYQLGLRIQ